jgi:hypothetical protein
VDRIAQLGWFVNKVFHRFNGKAKATAFVVGRAAKPAWVQSWVAREVKLFATHGAEPPQQQQFCQSAAFVGIAAHLDKAAWDPPKAKPPAGLEGQGLHDWTKSSRRNFLRAQVVRQELAIPNLERAP